MNRLQKKCFFASTGFHLFMLVILFVGPAFLASRERSEDALPVIEIIPMITTDAMVEPTPGNPAPAPPPPAPAPAPPATERTVTPPKPTPPEPKEPAPTPEPSLEPVKRKVVLPKESLKPVARTSSTKSKPPASNNDSQAREDARRSAEIKSALQGLRSGLSSSTKVEMPGYGGGGPTYANFLQSVKSLYAKAWAGTVPAGATDETTYVKVSVTIGRDGTVISSRIERSSGKPLVDASVQSLLNRIKKAVPLPADSKDSERTVEITFEVNPRTLAG